MIYTNVLFFLWRRDTLLCFKHIPLNSTILLILKSPVIFEAKLTSEICGFLFLSRDTPIQPHNLKLPVLLLINLIRLISTNTK